MGLALATLSDWKLTVNTEVTMAETLEIKNIHILLLVS